MIGVEPAPLQPRGPAVIERGHLNAICALPDVLQLAWCAEHDDARAVLSDRERVHAAKLAVTLGTTIAAAYVRAQLMEGDHVKARARIALTPGAVLTLGGRLYTVTGRRGAFDAIVVLRGERGGLAELMQPRAGDGRWWLYRGGLGRANTKTEGYRRDDSDGTFTAAP